MRTALLTLFLTGTAIAQVAPPATTYDELVAAVRAPAAPVATDGPRGYPITAPAGTIGRPRIYQYTNSGVPEAQQYNACGQAALATVLSTLGVKPEDPTNRVMQDIYAAFPPDILWGRFGTSFRQVEKCLTKNGVTWRWAEGEAALMESLRRKELVMMMVDIGATEDEGWGPIGGHWVVVYAADDKGVHLSNWPRDGHCGWHSLRRAWDTQLTRAFFGGPPWTPHRWFLVAQ